MLRGLVTVIASLCLVIACSGVGSSPSAADVALTATRTVARAKVADRMATNRAESTATALVPTMTASPTATFLPRVDHDVTYAAAQYYWQEATEAAHERQAEEDASAAHRDQLLEEMRKDYYADQTAEADLAEEEYSEEPLEDPWYECDPAYPDVCIPPVWVYGDLDCLDLDVSWFTVYDPDPHWFDDDDDGIGCES